jgi:PST family polysaccharide transporter
MVDVAALGGRAVYQLAVRTVVTRLITLVGMIALARLLTPADFGTFAAITVIVTAISIIGDFGLTSGLIQQDHEPTRLELSTALVGSVAIWGAITVAVWLVAGFIPSLAPALPPDAPQIARTLSITLFLAGLRAVPTVMLSRGLRFGPLAAIEVAQQAVYFGVAIALAAAGLGVWSFALAGVAQGALATILVNSAWRRWVGLTFDLGTARRLLGFGVSYQLAWIMMWGREAVVPIFGALAGGLSAIGFLGFAWRNGQLVTAIEQIVARVAFPAFSRLQRDTARLAVAVTGAVESSFLGVVLVQAWIIAVAPILVPAVFGDPWQPATPALQLVCIGSLAGAPTWVLRSYINSRGDSRLGLVLASVALAVLVVAMPILAIIGGLVGAACAFVISSFTGLAIQILATRGALTFPWRSVLRILIELAIPTAVAWLIAMRIGGLSGLAVSWLSYAIGAGVILWASERRLVEPALVVVRDSLWAGRFGRRVRHAR